MNGTAQLTLQWIPERDEAFKFKVDNYKDGVFGLLGWPAFASLKFEREFDEDGNPYLKKDGKSREGFYDLDLISAQAWRPPQTNSKNSSIGVSRGALWGPKCVFGKNMHMLGRAQSLCLGTFTVISSSQIFSPSLLDMTRKDFRVPGPKSIAKSRQ